MHSYCIAFSRSVKVRAVGAVNVGLNTWRASIMMDGSPVCSFVATS